MRKRYVVELSLYVWADNDKSAINQAESIAAKERQQHDNSCDVVAITEVTGLGRDNRHVFGLKEETVTK